jgi:signal transduction histidine kinase
LGHDRSDKSEGRSSQAEAPASDSEAKVAEEGSNPRVADLVHDIRTPLVAVRGYAKMLLEERDGPLNPTQREYVAIVVENANRVVRLINDLEQLLKKAPR